VQKPLKFEEESSINSIRSKGLAFCVALVISAFVSAVQTAGAQSGEPSILVNMHDAIGITNISAYSHGLMGHNTPNIDKLAKGGLSFTDYYGEQSCTAGRSALITGQSPCRWV
jgi:arylsulfatase